MALLLLLTGSAGFLASYFLLLCGVGRMWLRYPVAVLCAYLVFLLLLRAWLALQGRRRDGDSHANFDPLSAVDLQLADALTRDAPAQGFGGAADFAGGGAGGDWAEAADVNAADLSVGATDLGSIPSGAGVGSFGGGAASGGPVSGGASSGGGLLDSLNVSLDLDGEGCAVLLALLAVVAALVVGLVVSVYVVWAAPALLAEILVDGLLVAGLYRRMKRVERRHWLRAVVRRTWLPVAITLASFAAAGYLMQRAAPRARTAAEFWQAIS